MLFAAALFSAASSRTSQSEWLSPAKRSRTRGRALEPRSQHTRVLFITT